MTRSVPPPPDTGNRTESPVLERHTRGPDTLVCNRRIASSPAVRPPSSSRDLSPTLVALAVGALANSPAPIVPAPTASDLLKKERRLRKPVDRLTLSATRARVFICFEFLISGSRSTLPPCLPSDVVLSSL